MKSLKLRISLIVLIIMVLSFVSIALVDTGWLQERGVQSLSASADGGKGVCRSGYDAADKESAG
jgi:hypothetical protein